MKNPSERHLDRQLRLFLSVDLVGSTAYKSRQSSEVQPWLKVFYEFFRDFPVLLRRKFENESVDPPQLWKTLGDEIVFVAILQKRAEAERYLIHFREALLAYRDTLKAADRLLDLKGTAWLAGFPVGNSVVYLPDGSKNQDEETEDFIGPSMDIGFRLKDFASPKRIAISVELAYLLTANQGPGNLSLFFTESAALKGVIGGRPYPVFWINIFQDDSMALEALEDRLKTGKRDPVNTADACVFCRKFIDFNGSPFFLPFIESDPSFNEKPGDFDAKLKDMEAMWGNLDPDSMPPDAADGVTDPNLITEAFDDRLKKDSKTTDKNR